MDVSLFSMENSDSVDLQNITKRSRLLREHSVQAKKICAKEERNASIKKVSLILQKSEGQRTSEETQTLNQCSEAVEEVQLRWRRRDEAKRRLEEFEEPIQQLKEKCQILAQAIAQSQHLVVYTGAGISTAAKIPDYRGTNGIWTRLQQGKEIENHDLSLAEPTFTHMALSKLYHHKILKYVVSQNCDGLHLRSGLPKCALSELHGNMNIEVCKSCRPAKEIWRTFDVTENTARYSHNTMRKCYMCNGPLVDTIVHFGERGTLQWPLNWSGACKNSENATTILCLGSSLKVLKRYPWLWQMDKPAKKRPNLYIVNLQWTPKDDCANIKIHGKCDIVMEIVMNLLGISVPVYDRKGDPIFAHSTLLCAEEQHTTSRPSLSCVSIDTVVDLKQETERPLEPTQAEDCDIKSNKSCLPHETANSTNKMETSNSVFSIDRILNGNYENSRPNLVVDNLRYLQNYQSLLSYYYANSLLQNRFYQDMLYYPYQTFLLYPGLHSIINPNTFFNDSKLNLDVQCVVPKIEEVKSELDELSSCKFCSDHYNSMICLFYTKAEPVFLTPQFQLNKPLACFCCENSTDEDCEMETKDTEVETKDAEVDDGAKGTDKEQGKIKTQGGWFGKGYRKNRRFKKR